MNYFTLSQKILRTIVGIHNRSTATQFRHKNSGDGHFNRVIAMAPRKEALLSAYQISRFIERRAVTSPHTCG